MYSLALGDILGIKDSLTEFWSSHQVLVHVFKGPWPQLSTSRSRLHINWTPMCPAQTNLSISHFLQLFRMFFLRGVMLGPGISGKILKMPGHTHSHPEIHGPNTHAGVIFTAKREERIQKRSGRQCMWAGIWDRKHQRGSRERWGKRDRERQLGFAAS